MGQGQPAAGRAAHALHPWIWGQGLGKTRAAPMDRLSPSWMDCSAWSERTARSVRPPQGEALGRRLQRAGSRRHAPVNAGSKARATDIASAPTSPPKESRTSLEERQPRPGLSDPRAMLKSGGRAGGSRKKWAGRTRRQIAPEDHDRRSRQIQIAPPRACDLLHGMGLYGMAGWRLDRAGRAPPDAPNAGNGPQRAPCLPRHPSGAWPARPSARPLRHQGGEGARHVPLSLRGLDTAARNAFAPPRVPPRPAAGALPCPSPLTTSSTG